MNVVNAVTLSKLILQIKEVKMSKKKQRYDYFMIIHDFANVDDEHKRDHVEFINGMPSKALQGLMSLANVMSRMPNFTYVEKTKLNELKNTLTDILVARFLI